MTEAPDLPVILFVDDEPLILQGLRRMLRAQRKAWQMEFAEGGPAALERLAAGPVDAVVSDMRMPGVNGAEVLARAAALYPECVRIILSGYADRDLLLHAMGPAHRLLSKPADSETLTAALSEALALRALLPRARLRDLVGGLKSLPVPSQRYFELLRALESPLASAKSVGDAIEQDMGLTAQLLRLANSSYFGLPRRLTRAREAVEMLGLDAVRALLTLSEFYVVDSADPARAAAGQALAERSLRIGSAARRIAGRLGLSGEQADAAATAGLLSHIAISVLRLDRPAELDRAGRTAEADGTPIRCAETDVFGVSHAEIGAYLAGLWGFGPEVVEAIAFHHVPRAAPSRACRALTAVHIAQACAALAEPADSTLFRRAGSTPALDAEYLLALGLEPDCSAYLP
jgi:HD-like signal output (HDOD) protein